MPWYSKFQKNPNVPLKLGVATPRPWNPTVTAAERQPPDPGWRLGLMGLVLDEGMALHCHQPWLGKEIPELAMEVYNWKNHEKSTCFVFECGFIGSSWLNKDKIGIIMLRFSNKTMFDYCRVYQFYLGYEIQHHWTWSFAFPHGLSISGC